MAYKRLTVTASIALGCAVCAVPAQARTDGQNAAMMLALTGTRLTTAQADKLEQQLKAHPDNLSIRTELLGYNSIKAPVSSEARAGDDKQITWIITHRPQAAVAGTLFAKPDALVNPAGYAQAKSLWQKAITAHPKNVRILANAAAFYTPEHARAAARCLKICASLDPRNPHWPDRLGQLYHLEFAVPRGGNVKAAAAQALKYFKEALALTQSGRSRFYLLGSLGDAALAAGKAKDAAAYAHQLLRAAAKFRSDWNYGNAIFTSHSILGQLAIERGNIKRADQQLLLAGQTPGSPQLDSFGPDLTLAKELLAKRQRMPVLRFFQAVGKFWVMGRLRLVAWEKIIKAGGTPDVHTFGLP